MLVLKNIKKTYRVGDIETKALCGIDVAFRKNEFVAILGASGSGKTTCLNIIGGLDRYDDGDLIIKGKSTREFTDKDWDAYRNNSIGFVFQSYNLIAHLSIVSNVELGMTLSGVSKSQRRKRALDVLERVGLKDHLHKNPSQLSGGQMQRVAIARALVNDPEILLCDEPTGALDKTTGVHIMDLIQEIASDKLVIMVTHNPEIAEKYAGRIVRFEDGVIIDDSHPYQDLPKPDSFSLKKTSMSFLTALSLSLQNILTKKGRTTLTAFASSIGIIGIALILSLSTGFQQQIDEFQSDTLAEFPIIVMQQTTEVDREEARNARRENVSAVSDSFFTDAREVYPHDPSANRVVHRNVITDDFIDYVSSIDPRLVSSFGFTRVVNMNLLQSVDGNIRPIQFGSGLNSAGGGVGSGGGAISGMSEIGLSSYPTMLDTASGSYIELNYDLLSGAFPQDPTELVLVVDAQNRVNHITLGNLGLSAESGEAISFADIVGMEYRLVHNNDYYIETEFGAYMRNSDMQGMYESADGLTLTIVGIVRQNPDTRLALLSPGIAYSDELSTLIIGMAMGSDIVKAQKEADFNVMSREPLTEEARESFLSFLGGNAKPMMMMIYPQGFDEKSEVIALLDDFNAGRADEEIIIFSDLADRMVGMVSGIMDGITLVLIAFAATALIVSFIMIAIITYISVLERTKEIGILKALGARKKDITRVFNAETFIIGAFSGILGISIAMLLAIPINNIIYNMAELTNVANLQTTHAAILLILSIALTVLGGWIPAKMASKKDAVEALRTE